MKLKQYRYTRYYRGIHLDTVCVCKNIKEAAEILDTSAYLVKTYGGAGIEPNVQIAIENPGKCFAAFEHSGEAGYFVPRNLIGKMMPFDEAQRMVDEHREECKTYQDTLKKYNK